MSRYKHLFGPVNSRRLGLSLGVDLVPYKYCPLNCVYCEVQTTTHLVTKREEFFPVDEILGELDLFLRGRQQLDYITFSGAGEPTLHSGIGRIIQYIKKTYPSYKLALLTNGVLLNDPSVRAEVLPCDLVLPSLDSATQAGYEKINRPKAELRVEDLISGLAGFRDEYSGVVWLEVFIIAGINDSETELEALIAAIDKIKPGRVQLNALDRPGAEEWVQTAPLELLQEIQARFSARLAMPVEIIAKAGEHLSTPSSDDVIQQIEATLIRRPCTAEDLAVTLGLHINEVSKVLRELHLDARVDVKREVRGVFYSWRP